MVSLTLANSYDRFAEGIGPFSLRDGHSEALEREKTRIQNGL
jgi:hypothetical protein